MLITDYFKTKLKNSVVEVEVDSKLNTELSQHGYQHGTNPVEVSINHFALLDSIAVLKVKSEVTSRFKFYDNIWLLRWIKTGRYLRIKKNPDPEMQKQISEELGIGISVQLTKHFFKIQQSTVAKIDKTNKRASDFSCESCHNRIINVEAKGSTSVGTRNRQIKHGITQKGTSQANIRIISATLLKENQISHCIYRDPPVFPPDSLAYKVNLLKTDHYARVFNLIGQKELSEYFYLMKKRIKHDRDFSRYKEKNLLYSKLKSGSLEYFHKDNIYVGNINLIDNGVYLFTGIDKDLISLDGFLNFNDYETDTSVVYGENQFEISTDGVCLGYIKNISDLPEMFKHKIEEKIRNKEINHYQEYTSIVDIDTINYSALEEYFSYVFTNNGFEVKVEYSDGKLRYDFLITRNNKKYIIEIKRSVTKFKFEDVRRRLKIINSSKNKVVFITNQKLSEKQILKLKNDDIIIIDRSSLKKIVKNNKYFVELLS